MENEFKEWKNLSNSEYQLFVKNTYAGTVNLKFKRDFTGWYSSFVNNKEKYFIRSTGPWENTFIVSNQDNIVLLCSNHEKWYNKSFSMDYQNSVYKIIYSSLPSPSWSLFKDEKKIVSYAFGPQNELILKQFNANNQYALIFDFILIHLLYK